MANDKSELLTPSEAAQFLRTTVGTLKFWRHKNRGPGFVKSGRRVLYRKAALRAFLRAKDVFE